jgi:putative phage-type endonuclease
MEKETQTLSLTQGTPEWLAWRNEGIGSSDAPMVMNVSPYRTAYQLWEEKLGRGTPQKSNYAMEKGQRLEPQARAHYELLNDRPMPPLTVIHQDYPFIRASLDGANEEMKRILEIKCAGKDTYRDALIDKKLPEHHMIQVQHQLLVTGFLQCDYFVFYENKCALVEVFPNHPLMEKLLKELIVFWDCVKRDMPPPLCEKDHRRMKREAKKKGQQL